VKELQEENTGTSNEKNELSREKQKLEKVKNGLQKALKLRTKEIGQINGKLETLSQQLKVSPLVTVSKENDMNN